MDSEKIKRIFPFLKSVNLDDPGIRRSLALMCVGGAVLIVVIMVMLSEEGGAVSVVPAEADAGVTLDTPVASAEDRSLGMSKEQIYSSSKRNFGEDLFSFATSLDEAAAAPADGDAVEKGKPERSGSDVPELFRDYVSTRDDARDDAGEDEERGESAEKARDTKADTPLSDAAETKSKSEQNRDRARQQLLAMGIDPDTGELLSGAPLNVGTETGNAGSGKEEEKTNEEEAVAMAPSPVMKNTGGMSSLEDRSWGGMVGMSSLDRNSREVFDGGQAHPFEVMFSRDMKISSGERIPIRILEDMLVENVKIPANSPLSGICQINGNRLQIVVNAIKIGAKIYTLNLEAYDTDGLKGLYCPETAQRRGLDRAADETGNIITSALQSGIAGYAGQVVSAGANVMRNAKGVTTISVSSGYRFYLMKKEN